MSRPPMPIRSASTRTAGPPSDAVKPDDKAVSDVYKSVQETGSLELAARKLQKYAAQRTWEDDPEEAEYMAARAADDEDMEEEDEDDVMDGRREVVHLQEVLPGLWIGDLVSAMDMPGLEERGITNICSLLRPRLNFADHLAVYPLEIDDAADTDILTHLPSCVAWIHEALEKRERSINPEAAAKPMPPRDKVIDKIAAETKPGGVLVHCQAGMSRSATVVSAFLMQTLELGPLEAIEMLREKRPVIDPSETFLYQLGLFWNADGRVSLKDRSTRQFYMERTTSQFMNGDGSAPPMDKMAKYPATPSDSTPATPMGGQGRRKIRCRSCRRHLAVREHMMDHILDQSPVSRPRTPSNFSLPSPRESISSQSGFTPTEQSATFNSERQRRLSAVSDIVNPLTGMPGRQSRHASISSAVHSPTATNFPKMEDKDPSPLYPGGVPLPRKNTITGLNLTASSPDAPLAPRIITDNLPGREPSKSVPIASDESAESAGLTYSPKSVAPNGSGATPRPYRTAAELNASLPPHLLALRGGGGSSSALSSPFNQSPTSSPEKDVAPQLFNQTGQRSRSQSSSSNSGTIGRKMSLLAMTPAAGRPGMPGGEGVAASSGPPILVNQKCSGYFVEPLTWMEPFLKNGNISGKIVCPNEKCGVKIGNFDWAGVQCGCKEWVTPGFCISRSKVDEVW